MNRQDVLNKLHEGETTIIFEKANGEMRRMLATLNMVLLPVEESKERDSTRKHNPDVQAVWDLESNGWRSFRWDKLRDVDGDYYRET